MKAIATQNMLLKTFYSKCLKNIIKKLFLTESACMQAFLCNLLMGRFFGEGTVSTDFRANKPKVKRQNCLLVCECPHRILVRKACIYKLRFVLTEVIMYIPSP